MAPPYGRSRVSASCLRELPTGVSALPVEPRLVWGLRSSRRPAACVKLERRRTVKTSPSRRGARPRQLVLQHGSKEGVRRWGARIPATAGRNLHHHPSQPGLSMASALPPCCSRQSSSSSMACPSYHRQCPVSPPPSLRDVAAPPHLRPPQRQQICRLVVALSFFSVQTR